MDLWNFCKVWTLKNRPKALLLICFYCGGGKNEAHVCSATFHCPAFSCVMGVRGHTGDTRVTVHNSGEGRSSWRRSSRPQESKLYKTEGGKEQRVDCFKVKSSFGKRQSISEWLCLRGPHRIIGASLYYLIFGNGMSGIWKLSSVKNEKHVQSVSDGRRGLCRAEQLLWV